MDELIYSVLLRAFSTKSNAYLIKICETESNNDEFYFAAFETLRERGFFKYVEYNPKWRTVS